MRLRVSRLFAVATENVTNPQYQALEREWEPKLTAASDANFMNSKLFSRIAAVYSSLSSANLSAAEKRLTERLYDLFIRRGAQLGEAEKRHLSKINQELASLYASTSGRSSWPTKRHGRSSRRRPTSQDCRRRSLTAPRPTRPSASSRASGRSSTPVPASIRS